MAKEQTFNDMIKYSEKLSQLVKKSEYNLPISVHYLDNGAVLVTIFKGMRTITRALFEDGILAVGSAKCNAVDVYSRKVGQEISKARAYQNWAEKKEALWISRSKPITREFVREFNLWDSQLWNEQDYKMAFGKSKEYPKYGIPYQE